MRQSFEELHARGRRVIKCHRLRKPDAIIGKPDDIVIIFDPKINQNLLFMLTRACNHFFLMGTPTMYM